MTSRPVVVLKGLSDSRELGLAAEAAAVCGAQKIVLVENRCKLDHNAFLAAGEHKRFLVDSKEYPTWEDFLKSEPQTEGHSYFLFSDDSQPLSVHLQVATALLKERAGSQNSNTQQQGFASKKFRFSEQPLKDWLNAIGMYTEDRPNKALDLLKQLCATQELTERDYSLLEAVIQQTIRKLKHPSS